MPRLKITFLDAQNIRAKSTAGADVRGLASEYGLSANQIWRILSLKSWGGVATDSRYSGLVRGEQHGPRSILAQQRADSD